MTFELESDRPAALSCTQLLSLVTDIDRQPALLIDLRSASCFRRGHLAGSHRISAPRLLSSEFPDGEWILISERPDQAIAVIEALHSEGYHRRIRYLADGLRGWRARGLPLERVSDQRQASVGRVLRPVAIGTGLILVAALLTSLPLLALGVLLLWGAGRDVGLIGRLGRQRLEV
jgi:rhodanese-related sulfurtransferase